MSDDRKPGQVIISTALSKKIWFAIHDMRDLWISLESEPRAARLTDLLCRMQEAGMAAWIPTLEEMRAAGPLIREGDGNGR